MLDKYDFEYKVRIIELHKSELQKGVNEFLANKDNSLEDRWEVWTKYSQKKNHRWIYSFNQKKDEAMPECLVNYEDKLDCNRGTIIEYDSLVDTGIDDDQESEVKEWLMKENFGSFRFAW